MSRRRRGNPEYPHWPERLELDCFATLAMTDASSAPRIAEQMDMQPVAHPKAVFDA